MEPSKLIPGKLYKINAVHPYAFLYHDIGVDYEATKILKPNDIVMVISMEYEHGYACVLHKETIGEIYFEALESEPIMGNE